ncbi:MAG TPA: hypothetical protein DCR97_13950 [Deltaproteobacteria bacterium]|nr:hypothetical protein [Deltaproteobacteria bacterium]
MTAHSVYSQCKTSFQSAGERHFQSAQEMLMIGHMEPFDDRTMEPLEDQGYGATPCFQPEQ